MYTVEHNVKVFDFGDVHPAHLGRLQSQWIATITGGGGAGANPLAGLYTGHDSGDVRAAEDEEEEDEE
jgi:hypothetical protein